MENGSGEKDVRHSVRDPNLVLAIIRIMNAPKMTDPELSEADSLEQAMVGVNAKTVPYLMAQQEKKMPT